MKKPKQLYVETYRGDGAPIPKPRLNHLADGFAVDRATIRAAGVIQNPDGSKQEFQDIRVYLFDMHPGPSEVAK